MNNDTHADNFEILETLITEDERRIKPIGEQELEAAKLASYRAQDYREALKWIAYFGTITIPSFIFLGFERSLPLAGIALVLMFPLSPLVAEYGWSKAILTALGAILTLFFGVFFLITIVDALLPVIALIAALAVAGFLVAAIWTGLRWIWSQIF